MATRPMTINPHTGQPMPAYLQQGRNPISGSLNDPFMEAQHNYAGPGPAALTAAMRRQGLSFGNLSPSGGGRGRGPSLAASGLDPESARSIAVNDYLADLSGERAGAYAADQAAGAAASDRSTVQRAAAIANDPNTSAYGRPIVGGDGNYATGDPTGQPPVNRQAIAAQMAPGLIAPPAPEKVAAVTFGAPKSAIVNGNKAFIREGSDGFIYDTARRKIDPAALQPEGDEKADYTLDGVRYSGATNKPIAGTQGAAKGPQLSATQRDELAIMDTVQAMSKEALALGNKTGWAGTGGSGWGSAAQFMAKNFGAGSPEAEELRNYIGNIKGTVAKLRGGTAFSAAEEKMLDSYTPSIDDSPMVIQTKAKSLDKFIDAKRKATTGGPGALTGGGGGTVKLSAPDGSGEMDVPADQAEHYLKLGAKRVGG